MLNVLNDAMAELPELIASMDGWQSLLIDYHRPWVERVWCKWHGYRINLHVVYGCKPSEALFHPHPWPSAVHVLRGCYEMDVGYGTGTIRPPVAARLLLGPGSQYEMTDINGWHSVRPLGVNSLSVMVTGKPWVRESVQEVPQLRNLPPVRMQEILDEFQDALDSNRFVLVR